MSNFIIYAFLLIILIFIISCSVFRDKITLFSDANEHYGALQSLYSSDGPQDQYLTLENDPDLFYSPWLYWNNIVWNLPTRNLGTIAYYPYLYEHNIDRYGTLYPYWSL